MVARQKIKKALIGDEVYLNKGDFETLLANEVARQRDLSEKKPQRDRELRLVSKMYQLIGKRVEAEIPATFNELVNRLSIENPAINFRLLYLRSAEKSGKGKTATASVS
jgi:hypothetical protein